MSRVLLCLVSCFTMVFADSYTRDRKPVPIRRTSPCYTEQALRARIEGDVYLNAEVHPDGLLHSIVVKRSLERSLDASAIETVKQWRFKPAEERGNPVVAATTIVVNFRFSDPGQRCSSGSRGER